METEQKTWLWILPSSLLILAVISVPVMAFDNEGLPRFRALRGELQATRMRNDKLQYEITDLKSKIDALRRDGRAIERIARDELGMIRDGEVIFVVDDER